ncbi:MAG: fimbria major subunit, partial [Tannerella sp.]|nr:fimbria major subunit [Tannerella sp.]
GEFVNDFGKSDGSSVTPSGNAPMDNAYVNVDINGDIPIPTSAQVVARTPKYAVENTSASPYHQGVLTYVSVRAKFYPNEIITAFTSGGTPDSLTRVSNAAVVNELYVYMTPSGEYLYFNNSPAGAAWKAAYTGATFVGNYKNGYCYYLVYLDPKTAYSAPYASVRNLFYDTRITKINSLGYPTPGEPKPEEPLGTKTMLTVDVTIQPWVMVTMDDVELGPL